MHCCELFLDKSTQNYPFEYFAIPGINILCFLPAFRCADEAAREERVSQAGGVGAAEGGGAAAAAGRVQPRPDGGEPDRLQHPAGPHGALVQRRLPRPGRPGAQLARPARRPHRDAAQAPLPRPQEDGAAQAQAQALRQEQKLRLERHLSLGGRQKFATRPSQGLYTPKIATKN
jgi:hypothetical protein